MGFCWIVLNSLLTYTSVFVLAGTACGFRQLGSVISQIFTGNMFLEYGSETTSVSLSFLDMLGYTPAQAILMFVALFFAGAFYSIAVGLGSITIGQLYAKHKVVGSILAYIGIYFVVQIATFVSMFIISFRSIFGFMSSSMAESADIDSSITNMMSEIYRPIFPIMLVIFLVVGIICYIASVIIVKKKVNLD